MEIFVNIEKACDILLAQQQCCTSTHIIITDRRKSRRLKLQESILHCFYLWVKSCIKSSRKKNCFIIVFFSIFEATWWIYGIFNRGILGTCQTEIGINFNTINMFPCHLRNSRFIETDFLERQRRGRSDRHFILQQKSTSPPLLQLQKYETNFGLESLI